MSERIDQLDTLPGRPSDGHKGTFGRVSVIGGAGGDARMIGAPALAGLGAARSGCGVVTLACPASIVNHAIEIAPACLGEALPEDPTGEIDPSAAAQVIDETLGATDAFVLGPGMADSEATRRLVMRCVSSDLCSGARLWVLDAGALRALAATDAFTHDLRVRAVLTPHPGEARGLLDALGLEGDPAGDDEARTAVAIGLAQRIGAVVVLKGARSVVSDGLRVWTCGHSVPALATAGTGDVLAGVIAGIAAQVPALDPFMAAAIGVDAHALAGLAWSEAHGTDAGMLAHELAEGIPGALASHRG